MGNFEKLVVLTVLFLSAVVLAVSLSTGDDEAGPTNPILAAEKSRAERDAGAKRDGGRPTLSAEGTKSKGRAAGGPGAKPKAQGNEPGAGHGSGPAPVGQPARPRVLKAAQGLEPSALEGYMLYTCADGDTWWGLAARFYKSGSFAPLLRAANEDVEIPVQGDALLVPVYDFRSARRNRQPVGPAPRRSLEQAPADEPEQAIQTARNEVYVVQDGDTLSEIAQALYGSAARWKDLYEANRDVLESPDWLDVGTTLKVP